MHNLEVCDQWDVNVLSKWQSSVRLIDIYIYIYTVYIYIYIYPKWWRFVTKVIIIGYETLIYGQSDWIVLPEVIITVIGWCMTKVMEIYMAKVISLPGWISLTYVYVHMQTMCVYIYIISHIRVSEHSPCVLDKCVKGEGRCKLWCSLLRPGVLPSVDRSCNQWYILFAFYMYRNAVRMLFIVYQ